MDQRVQCAVFFGSGTNPISLLILCSHSFCAYWGNALQKQAKVPLIESDQDEKFGRIVLRLNTVNHVIFAYVKFL